MALPLALPIIQGALGAGQLIAGAAKKVDRPDFASREYIDKAERLARNRLANPFAERAQAEEQASLGISNAIEGVRSGNVGGRVDESAIFNAAANAQNQISMTAQELTRAAEGNLSDILLQQQQYDYQKHQYDMDNYMLERDEKLSLITGGLTNMFGATNSAIDMKMQGDYLDSISGGEMKPKATSAASVANLFRPSFAKKYNTTGSGSGMGSIHMGGNIINPFG